ncbi:MAG TPA: pseudouridine synthase [Bacteroidia bacterium]|nr:pseudouridine synthase [Bacteroidota bacterium]MBP9790031.1 pseudouridine synthase [Bacteroidia bacterium]MBK7429707.1 pseudouridine synthase [Bacteroidota bacterium]MBK7570594.1 pseudouridine synthase [Bacteroidota bacterium]HQV98932.1 pseudouridine synthase [Bacteroidia bacterium]
MFSYYAIYKPFGMLSQFTKEGEHQTLADLSEKFPIDVYPVGRLDADSEGLLLLTNDKRVNSKLLDPTTGHQRTYLVQVEGEVTEEALETLRRGMELSIDGKIFLTRPAKAEVVNELPDLPERNPPVRFRKNIPTSWIRLSLVEGKNRQVRKMTAKVGFPTLRLIRESIHEFSMSKMVSGNIETVERAAFYSKLGLR